MPPLERVGDLLTMQLGPEQVLLTVNIRFRRGLDVQQLEETNDREDFYRRRLPAAAWECAAGCLGGLKIGGGGGIS